MKLVLVAPMDGASGNWIAQAFAEQGWTVKYYDYRTQSIHLGVSDMNRDLFDLVLRERPDLFLVLKGEVVSPDTYRRLGKHGIRTAMWHFDPRDGRLPWVQRVAINCQTFFTIGKGLLAHYKSVGVHAYWLPEAANPDVHGPWPASPEESTYRVGFVGTIHDVPGREEWLLKVQNAYGDDLHLWGSYPGLLVGKTHHGRAEEHVGLRGDDGLAWVVSHTLVNLGRDRNPEIERSYGARLYRTLSTGGFLLTNDTKGIREDFEGCLGVYSTSGDCVEKIRYWLDHLEERVRVAKNGFNLVRAKHLWTHRVQELAKVVGVN